MRKNKQEILKQQIILAILSVALSGTALALPQNGQVTTGSGTIAQNGTTMNINQNTQKMGMNWNSYNIAKNETVNYKQPNSSSIALNRVTGNNPSSIYGALNANGRVFLINPNGVMFGKGASVNVGGIVASTKNLSDADFRAGKYNFIGDSDAKVINQGTINAAPGGYVAFLANNVSNEGKITAPQGTVALGAGNAFTLSTDGTGKINLAVDQAAANAATVNSGSIQADGGYVVMHAEDAAAVVNSVVANTGIIQAHSLKNVNGEIVLEGGSRGIVNVGGTMDVSAADANTAGGNITVKGLYTNVNKDAQLLAKAIGTGAGGTIETSGDYLYVDKDAIINATSEQGTSGTWSLDPLYVIIGDNDEGSAWGDAKYNNDEDGSKTSKIKTSSIQTTLNLGTNVEIAVTDNNDVADIIVNSAIAKTAGTEATLTLKAERNVVINAPISSTSNALNMNFWSDSKGGGVGAVELNADLNSNGGNVVMGSGATIDAGSVGTYVGLTDTEFIALHTAVINGGVLAADKPKRTFTTKGGNFSVYGDLLLGTGSETTIDTTNGTSGGNVNVSGKIDSGNFYALKTFTADDIKNGTYTWSIARTAAKTNTWGTDTEGGSAVWDSYLTNLTSSLENSIALSVFAKTTSYYAYYIGAHEGDIADVDTNKHASLHNRTWYWTDGPEAGKSFFKETAKGEGSSTGMDYSYSFWHKGQPDNTISTDFWPNGQAVASIGYGWNSQWDDVGARNLKLKDGSMSIKGYIQETNNLRSALKVDSGLGNVVFGGDIGSQNPLYSLKVNNTGNVTTKGKVTLNGDLYKGIQYEGVMNIESTGKISLEKAVSATGHIYIGQTVAPTSVIAGGVLTAGGNTAVRDTADRNILIGTDDHRAGSVTLDATATADDGIAIYTAGNVTTNGLTAKGLVTTGNIVIYDSKAESIITLNGTTTTTSTADGCDDITIYGDKMALNGPVTTNGSTGVVTVSNYTAGNTIDLGSTSDDVANTLGLSSNEVNEITASKLVVGNNAAGKATKNINVTAGIAPAGTSVVHMYTGQDGTIAETTDVGTLSTGTSGTLNLAVTAAGSVNLDNANNITTFAAVSTNATDGTIRLNQGSNTLTIGPVDGLSGVTTNVANKTSAIVLATTGPFVNNVGTNGVQATGANSYWRIFSKSPDSDTFGPGNDSTYLQSGSYADWQTTYAQNATTGTQDNGTVNADDAANHYIFSIGRTIVITPSNQTKTYGTDWTGNTTYTVGVEGTNYSIEKNIYNSKAADDTAYINALITNNVGLSCVGYDATADAETYSTSTNGILATMSGIVSGGTTGNGYTFVVEPGTLTVDPTPLSVIVTGSKKYGEVSSQTSSDYKTVAADETQLKNGNKLNATGTGGTVNNTVSLEDNVGDYYNNYTGKEDTAHNVTADNIVTGTDGFAAGNYTITYRTKYEVDPTPLSVIVTGSKKYGEVSSQTSSDYKIVAADETQLKNGNKLNATGTGGTVNNTVSLEDNVGDYYNNYTGKEDTAHNVTADNIVTGTDGFAAGNYTITYRTKYEVDPTPLSVIVTGSKKYGEASSQNSSDYKIVAADETELKNGNKLNATGCCPAH